jgi:mannose-1-phosphate guanylyltransferase
MKAIVLAGGYGTRLKPLTERRPKPLLPVAGRPCIDYVLRSLVGAGFREIVITTSYMSDRVIKRIGDGLDYKASILYSFKANPAGTAGAVKRVGEFINDTFVVASGDVLADIDVAALYKYHKESGALATMALTRVEDPTQFGIVALDGKGRVSKFLEKPRPEEVFSDLVNAGIYVLEPEVLDFIPAGGVADFSANVFPDLLAKGKAIYGRQVDGLWMDIGRPRDLLRASLEVVRQEGKSYRPPGVEASGPLIVASTAEVEPGVKLRGPCYIGDRVHIGQGTDVQNTCIYEDAVVDRNALIQDSIIMEGTKIGWQSEIRDSVISAGCNIEQDVQIVSSIIGDDMTIKIHSRLEHANVSPPSDDT